MELKTRKKKGDDGSDTEQTLYKKLELPAQSPPDDEELVQQEHAALQALDQKLAEYNMMSHEYLVAYDQRYKVVEEMLESMQNSRRGHAAGCGSYSRWWWGAGLASSGAGAAA